MSTNLRNNFYVYGHYKKDNGELFYIGKGTNGRATSSKSRNVWWKNVVEKHGLEIKLLYEGLTEAEAHAKEIELIKQYGRRDLGLGPLINMTGGGDGVSGLVVSDDTKRKIGDAQKGNKNSLFGKHHTEDARRKISDSLKGNKNPMFGKHHSTEIKRKIGVASKG